MFCDRADHLDEFCFRRKRIDKRHFDYARNSYHNEFIDFLPHSYSHVMSHFLLSCFVSHLFTCFFLSSLMDQTIAHMVLVHERIALSLDALVTAHVLIVMIVSHVGLVFLLEGPTPTLSRDTWMIHIFSIVVHIPLDQVMRCKRL
jgi:hypothetical protein